MSYEEAVQWLIQMETDLRLHLRNDDADKAQMIAKFLRGLVLDSLLEEEKEKGFI